MNLALFDFDGTLTTRETFPDFLAFAAPPARVAAGRIALAPLYVGYKAGLVSGCRIRAAAIGFAFRGVSAARVAAAGERFAAQVLPGLLRAAAMERLAWHRARGDCVAVVSGGLELFLAPWCRRHGLALIGSRLAVREGYLTGRYLGAQCVGEEKARRVREAFALAGFPRVYAYGDTHEDHALLRLAHEPWYRWQPWREAAAPAPG
ncbi:HAD family hydrolase [Fulvimonas soli]|jgi:HAD superfamily hydrolase (TIGR01490 family)|uniref:HAD superfamily hydrolase (TIGR01490 family) n=1 Tax=Fulvimonas soli TaxID=155197 RepID=A0A316IFJ1_9GAMM|nr:HAD family hydrolase [Fulvimonas soli]PWK92397.1 HAD superfamily hydrolase (TIGR01490 family) [Fulvimonas soli]TNY25623.1 hydrolase [Fulvimonas soli]